MVEPHHIRSVRHEGVVDQVVLLGQSFAVASCWHDDDEIPTMIKYGLREKTVGAISKTAQADDIRCPRDLFASRSAYSIFASACGLGAVIDGIAVA